MKSYMALCLRGKSTIRERQELLKEQRDLLVKKMEHLQEDIAYIDWKQSYYDDVLSGKAKYTSNLIDTGEE